MEVSHCFWAIKTVISENLPSMKSCLGIDCDDDDELGPMVTFELLPITIDVLLLPTV